MTTSTDRDAAKTPSELPRRAGRWLCASCWPAALGVWLAHVSHAAFESQRQCAIAFTWLVAAGCLGVPAAGLRVLGPYLTARVCRAAALVCAAVCALLTLLYADGQMHPTATSLYASLILPMAIAVQAYNANRALTAQAAARTRGRMDCLADCGLRDPAETLDARSDEELMEVARAIEAVVAARKAGAQASAAGDPRPGPADAKIMQMPTQDERDERRAHNN